ncbi:MAG: type IVB pilus formation outer membrane protein, R64 PilN family [Pseudomonas sp. PGPPP4]|jgi:type IVB pilus formation R64 PilN family outer membrane protein|uniref:PilN family type IVB pilus formation outer membrane protein n=2 Tax=Pseudomonas TaxID=286 RepID=UPI0005CAB73C|nr:MULTISPECIES: PilN family type IVB pilus formation outer membrane protein [Pseudomonas]KIZ52732.1 secretin [Pseudomonas oryzihabitans]MBA1256932.1 PilN family type IVB pilus formation outer membrane protein [Pseudomonas psychrotolerans]MDU4058906.1 PilN family type IVB pilus formation outer membrane protein [Pseudomonas oryzihabitans]OYT78589.1 MAG: type IVB pilus formation outer membrane protein, R64 PilN family [Pseudomonas sp. PGPPP4]
MTHPLRLSALAAALLLASCSVQRVDESAQRAENDAAMASQYAALLRNQQQQPKRETVVFSDKPWVSTQPVVAKRGMPSALDCELSYRPSGSVGITEIAQYITSQCGIAVLVSPDALNPNAGAASAQTASTGPAPIGNPSPDSLAGLLPAGVITNPATMGAAGTPTGSAYRATDFTSMGASSQVSGLKYSGKASGLLDEVTARLGLGWRYSPVERAVRISYFETRVFDVWSFGDKQVIASTVKSGMATAAGTSGSNSGGSSTSSGVTGDAGSNQSTTVTLESSILQDIQNNVKAMLSVSPAGRMYLAPSTGTLTVTDRPEVISRVEAYLNSTNRSITQQVLFNVKVFEVTLTDSDQLGLNWAAVYKSLNTKWGLSLSNTVAGISTSATSASVGIVDTANSAWAGSNAIVQALAEQGRVSNVRSPSVTTLNLQPAPLQIGNVQGYLASSQTTSTASVGSSTSLTPGTITSGFNMTLLPRVLDHDEMLLMVSINMSSKPTFQTFTSNGSSVQLPDYDAKSLSPKVKLRSGQTLILSGFEELNENAAKTGVGDPSFFGLGGSRTRTSGHSVLVVLITPIVTG